MSENNSNSIVTSVSELDENEIKYLATIVKKYSAYKNRTKSQELLLTLNALSDKSKKDIANIRKILKVEKALDTKKATQQKVTAIFRKENAEKRKLAEHKKYKIGGAIEPLRLAGQSMKILGDDYPDKSFHDFVQDLINKGYLFDMPVMLDSDGKEIIDIVEKGKDENGNLKLVEVKVRHKTPPVDAKGDGSLLFPPDEVYPINDTSINAPDLTPIDTETNLASDTLPDY